jgi:teichuronic acid biosynthesis glycosyltransferase TuaC
MRIAVVTTSYPSHEGDPSGHFVQAEVRQLEREGHEVHVVRPLAGGAFGWPGVAARLSENPLRSLEALSWISRARATLDQLRPDHVIAHWCVPCAMPIAMGRSDVEIVSHGGDVRLLLAIPTAARERTVKSIAARAKRWRFVSRDLFAALSSALSREAAAQIERIGCIVPPAIDVPDVGADVKAKRRAVAGRKLYVCAGRLVRSKRVDRVIDYVASADGERMLVVLGDGPERSRLERIAREWQLDARFLGTTTRREALGWIGAADELVHASRVEGLSTVVREASVLGVPVTFLGN